MSGKRALAFVASPLQLFNVYAAMKKFAVADCDVRILDDGKSNRHLQIQQCAELYGLNYELVSSQQMNIGSAQLLSSLLKSPFKKKEYDYLFFGDYRNGYGALYLTQNLKRGGRVVFVDDGNASIGVLQGLDVDKKTRAFYKFFEIWGRVLGVSAKDYFTVYRCDGKNKFNIIQNDMLKTVSNGELCDEIFFVGPAADVFADALGVSLEYVLNRIDYVLKKIKEKSPSEKIVFVPHGRFDNDVIENLCTRNGVEYRKLDQCIELYCVTRGCFPKAVYNIGSSSCLMNLKLMSPQTSVFDCDIEGPNTEYLKILQDIRSYYVANGVEYIHL